MKLDQSSNASILTTCPRDCYDTCGIIVNKINDEIIQVRGDPNHAVSQGKLCKKCSIAYNHEWIDPKARLTQPLRRVGAKGEGKFEPISWDAALAEIASKLKSIIDKHGAQAIYNAHYTGTISLTWLVMSHSTTFMEPLKMVLIRAWLIKRSASLFGVATLRHRGRTLINIG